MRQQSQLSAMEHSSVQTINNVTQGGLGNQVSQPTWNDPQIHIVSATGKSASTFYYICDFVPRSLEEDLVVGGQGEHQVVIKSGPKKPKLESLTLSGNGR